MLRRLPLGRGRRRVAALSALALAAVALITLVASLLGGAGDKAPQAATTSTATTEIRRQDLVEVEEEDGTLGYSGERAVVNRLSGTVTSLPSEGAVVRPDHTLFRVDRTPVILMDGRVPAYRTLSPGVSDGADVKQLEQDLRALGYDDGGAISVDRRWTAATTAAVERWQDAHGFDQTGSIELGRVVFQPGTRRVSSVEATLGGDAGSSQQGSGSSDSTGTTGASYSGSGATTRFASYTAVDDPQGTDTTPEATPEDDQKQSETKAKKKDEQEQQEQEKDANQAPATQNAPTNQAQPQGAAPAAGVGSSGAAASQGTGGSSNAEQSAPASTLLKTTSTRSQVVVKLDTAKESLAKKGARVTVELPSGGSVRGRIASVGKVATKADDSSSSGQAGDSSSSSSSTSSATVPVRISLSGRAALDQAPATVRFEKSRRKNVLAIPVTALLARAGDKYAVEVRSVGGRRLVAVTPGLYASGYVEITGAGLAPGMKVTDARV